MPFPAISLLEAGCHNIFSLGDNDIRAGADADAESREIHMGLI